MTSSLNVRTITHRTPPDTVKHRIWPIGLGLLSQAFCLYFLHFTECHESDVAVMLETRCCSTDCERPHCCCRLPNKLNFGSHWIFLTYLQWAGRFSPKLSICLGIWAPLRPRPSPCPKWQIDRFSRFVRITVVTNRHTDTHTEHATSVTIARILNK